MERQKTDLEGFKELGLPEKIGIVGAGVTIGLLVLIVWFGLILILQSLVEATIG